MTDFSIKTNEIKASRFSVAPMMDWTDNLCRMFHRQVTRRALLYSEMITAQAIRHGDQQRLLGFDAREKPVALQIGGHDPALLAEATRTGIEFGYDEVNLNVGCPSDRVQEGRFGACLMAEPELVAECVVAMQAASAAATTGTGLLPVPVSVKCRIGIDDQDSEADLNRFIETVADAGCTDFIIHARKAWLQGLSPKENREIPPLDYDRVHRLKARFPGLMLSLNGGLGSLDEALPHLADLDGVMLGRAAYKTPWTLAKVDSRVFGETNPATSREACVLGFLPFIEETVAGGVPLARMARHMMGLFQGTPGGRLWRRVLSEEGCKPGASIDVVLRALEMVQSAQRTANRTL